MKKKILGIALTAALIVTSSISVVYADKYGNGKLSSETVEKEDAVKQEREQLKKTAEQEREQLKKAAEEEREQSKKDIDSLREKLKEVHKDKEARKEIIKEIVELRKQNKDESIPLFINGKELKSDVPPVLKYGRVLIPVRAVTNALGAKVDWDEDTATATITKTVYGSVYGAVYDSTYGTSTITIELKLDSNIAIVNGQEVVLDVKAETNNNRMIVPIRFIAETFKNSVEWDEENGCAIIEDDDEDIDDEDVDEDDEESSDEQQTSEDDD